MGSIHQMLFAAVSTAAAVQKYLAITQFNHFWTSADAVTWTSRASAFDNTPSCCHYFSDGHFYVGTVTGTIWRTPDLTGGGTWTSTALGFQASTIAYNGTHYVACGNNGSLFTATDPTGVWTSRAIGMGTTAMTDVAYGAADSIWVCVGDTGRLITASDPTSTWTSRASGQGTNQIGCVAYSTDDGDTFAAGSSVATQMFSSANGTAWTSRTFPASRNPTALFHDGTQFIAACENGLIATNTGDGVTWTSRSGFQCGGGICFNATDGLYVVVGQAGRVGTSTDGQTWTSRGAPFGAGNSASHIATNGL